MTYLFCPQNVHFYRVCKAIPVTGEKYVNAKAKERGGQNAFTWAVQEGRLTTIDRLLGLPEDRRPDVDSRTGKVGHTCFTGACVRGDEDVVKRLVQQPQEIIDVNRTNNDGDTGFLLACYFGYISIIDILLELPKERLDVNLKDKQGLSGFMYACNNGHLQVVQKLLDTPNDRIDIGAKFGGRTGLDLAESEGHAEVAEAIRQHD